MQTTMLDIISILNDTVAMEANQYKESLSFLTQKSAFDALDGSSSGLIHISIHIKDGDYDAFEEAMDHLKQKLIEDIKYTFERRLRFTYPNQPSQVNANQTDDFTVTIKGYPFEDQIAWWATITGTDQCIIITLVHYPQ